MVPPFSPTNETKKRKERRGGRKSLLLSLSRGVAANVLLVELVGLEDLLLELCLVADNLLQLISIDGLDEHTSELTPTRLVVLEHSHDTLVDLLTKLLLEILSRTFFLNCDRSDLNGLGTGLLNRCDLLDNLSCRLSARAATHFVTVLVALLVGTLITTHVVVAAVSVVASLAHGTAALLALQVVEGEASVHAVDIDSGTTAKSDNVRGRHSLRSKEGEEAGISTSHERHHSRGERQDLTGSVHEGLSTSPEPFLGEGDRQNDSLASDENSAVGNSLVASLCSLESHKGIATDRVIGVLVAGDADVGDLLAATGDSVELTKLLEELDEVLLGHLGRDTSDTDTATLVDSREVLGMLLFEELLALFFAHCTADKERGDKDTVTVVLVGVFLDDLLGLLFALRDVVHPSNKVRLRELLNNLHGSLVLLEVCETETTELTGTALVLITLTGKEPRGDLTAVLEEGLDVLLLCITVEALDVDVCVTVAGSGTLVRRKENRDRGVRAKSSLAVLGIVESLCSISWVLELTETIAEGGTSGVGLDNTGVDVTVLGHVTLKCTGFDFGTKTLDKDLALSAVALAAVVLLVHDTAGPHSLDPLTVQLRDSLVCCLKSVKVHITVAERVAGGDVTGDTDRTDVTAGPEDVEEVLLGDVGVEVTDIDGTDLGGRRRGALGIKTLRGRAGRWNNRRHGRKKRQKENLF